MQLFDDMQVERQFFGQPRGGAILFDEWGCEEAVAFYPQRPQVSGNQRWLWWTGGVTPEVIDAVVELLCRRSELVNTIVIGGLGGYPLCMSQWTGWLVRWSNCPGRCQVIVDTRGLAPRRRQRLVAQTRRSIRLNSNGDPVAQTVTSIKSWIKERLR